MQQTPFQTIKNNIYAILSPVNGVLAFLGNCLSLFSVIFPPITWVCAAINALFSLGALLTGGVGLMQVNRSNGMQKGKGFAIAGLVLGALGLIAACLIPLVATSVGAAILGWLGINVGDAILVPVE